MDRSLLGCVLLALTTACATDPVVSEWVKTPLHENAPPNGLSQSGIDYGDWVGSEDFETARKDHPFVTSIQQHRSLNGDMSLVSALRSDGFNCDTLLPSYEEPVIWHCSNKVMEDVPMAHRLVWNWSVTFWGEQLNVKHSGGVVLFY